MNSHRSSNSYSSGPKAEKASKAKVLVLDLDETLVYCLTQPLSTNSNYSVVEGQSIQFYMYKRPGVKEFIKKMSKLYTLVLFITAIKEYANNVLKALRIKKYFSRVLHRSHCQVNVDSRYEKNIAMLGVPFQNIILIEDSAYQANNQPDNTLLVKPFRGEKDDTELFVIGKFLEKAATAADIRLELAQFIGCRSNDELENFTGMEEKTIEDNDAEANNCNVTEMTSEEEPNFVLPTSRPKLSLSLDKFSGWKTDRVRPKRESFYDNYLKTTSLETENPLLPEERLAVALPLMLPKSHLSIFKIRRNTH